VVSATGLTIEPICDARVLAAVHAETVGFAYAEFFGQNSSPPKAADLAVIWEERLADPSATALAARKDGRILGTVAIRRDPDFVCEGQLIGLHVLPEEWGQGVGAALHDAALLLLISRAFEDAGLWVISANARARGMYEARGWTLKPDIEFDYLGVTEVRYVKHLGGFEGRPIASGST
jgi:GNAT superfamily N-acetyltransferase